MTPLNSIYRPDPSIIVDLKKYPSWKSMPGTADPDTKKLNYALYKRRMHNPEDTARKGRDSRARQSRQEATKHAKS